MMENLVLQDQWGLADIQVLYRYLKLKLKFSAYIITARCFASAVCCRCVSVCLSVRPSVIRQYCAKTSKCRITETTPHYSAATQVSEAKGLGEIRTESLPAGVPKCRWSRL